MPSAAAAAADRSICYGPTAHSLLVYVSTLGSSVAGGNISNIAIPPPSQESFDTFQTLRPERSSQVRNGSCRSLETVGGCRYKRPIVYISPVLDNQNLEDLWVPA
ncbi:hypothetical protein K449DRAFT_433518 [Hypoxylon sp. EC38]|nr:hypothetical protein K449DRAFT_433518 [Hypoxylon sp. EC38]